MASYTIEDIELIRKKSGISYQEAVALLDYHNGNVARALVDLERNGRIKPENSQHAPHEERKAGHTARRSRLHDLVSRLYQFRLKVKKGDIVIINLSLLFTLLAVLISPHLMIIAAILILVLGYHVSFDKHDPDFAAVNLEKMVRSAAQNVKSTVNDFTRGFNEGFDGEAKPDSKADEPKPAETTTKAERSYYQSNPAAATYQAPTGSPVPTLQVPVQVESQDGSVRIEDDKDGYSNATIE